VEDVIKEEIIYALKCAFQINDPIEIVEIHRTTNKHIPSDYYTNIAMKISKDMKKNPMDIAEKIKENFRDQKHFTISIAKPGYINFTIDSSQKNEIVSEILRKNDLLSSVKTKKPEKIILEFVSANPTGPLHVGHGRGAIYGNIIAKFLKLQGHDVYCEYYVNDFGNQINKLILSVFSKIDKNLGKDTQDIYEGDYINEIASEIASLHKDHAGNISVKNLFEENKHHKLLQKYKRFIIDYILDDIKKTLGMLDVKFDNWFLESKLFEDDSVNKTINILKDSGKTKKIDGALMFYEEEPRVLIKSNGEYTYFASDLAYHDMKMREYDRIINVWGADHHGYVDRIIGGLTALGHDTNKLEIHLIQFANLFRGKEKVSMSTRKGEFVKLETLIDEIGIDSINYFYLMKGKDQHLDFDLEIAVSSNKNNPVYYIQYAHARIQKILDHVGDYKRESFNPSDLNSGIENEIVSTLNNFDRVTQKSVINLKPQILTNFLFELSQHFHSYYASEKFIKDDINYSKIYLIAATQRIIKCGLNILNINAPEKM
tara:strand:- start:17792 stop:19420 length:1629 start_codon:yes stop_codon:yes gene_type:complete